ncbi:hypothetical protein YK48G_07970 [Lentilactobacillus fungorum]|jgi:prevent-host-death family protein|uniref:Antitoxin n=1 Tax=Lentilactobacillus fungorum TaxID=2201250 RepID=A0ABQ3VWT7_9LACO|nr:type II toxin-antitoxin system Phd/YefM family antitoxin [Lentilactobacillus fungorum]GHP13372.1 hypothetical protein YK48G_07970 [Lentilactobacillus fungorum]
MEKVINPTKARAELFALIKAANQDSKPVLIAGSDDEKSAVLMSKRDYDAWQETLELVMNGQLPDALKRQDDPDVDLDTMMRDIDHE